MKIIVLGSGLVGRAIAFDLSKEENFSVTIVDNNPSALEKVNDPKITKKLFDLSVSDKVKVLLKDFDLVVNAVPGFMGFEMMKIIINSGKNVVDIAFYPEDPFELNSIAEENNVTALVDSGVSPGLSNLIIGYASSKLDKVEDIKIYVGGLPEDRSGYFEYKVVFSVTDVMEEYIRPARLIKDGKIIAKPALSDLEIESFPSLGKLEAFNSDGLRTLLKTIKCTNMVEKTLRYPGHADKMNTLIQSGLFSKNSIEINGNKVIPFEVTAKQLAEKMRYNEGDKDITLLKVIVNGYKDKIEKNYEYLMIDRFDEVSRIHSMARTTGFTASMCVRLLAEEKYRQSGIIPLEYIGKQSELYDFVIKGLEERGIIVDQTIN